MPLIRLITNVGTLDALRLGLGDLYRDGDVAEVSDAAAEEAIRQVWAVPAGPEPAPQPDPEDTAGEEPADDGPGSTPIPPAAARGGRKARPDGSGSPRPR